MDIAPERPEEFSPGLDPEMQEMADALADFKEKTIKKMKKSSSRKK
jgi:Mn-containing catalase